MKKLYNLLAIIVLTIFIAACSQTPKTQKGTVETQEKAPDNPVVATEEVDKKSLNAADRIGSQLEELGDGLTEEQRARLDELSQKYDRSRAGSQEERRAMRQQMQNEVNNILTPEQRAKLDQNRKTRKGASDN